MSLICHGISDRGISMILFDSRYIRPWLNDTRGGGQAGEQGCSQERKHVISPCFKLHVRIHV